MTGAGIAIVIIVIKTKKWKTVVMKRVINVAAEKTGNPDFEQFYKKIGDFINQDTEQFSEVVSAIILYPISSDRYRELDYSYPQEDGVPVNKVTRIAQLIEEGCDVTFMRAYIDLEMAHVPLLYPFTPKHCQGKKQ